LNIVSRLTGLFGAPGRARPPSRWPTEPDFWRLWLCGLVMFSVRWIETIAVAVFVYQETGSAFLVAMITMLRMAPLGLFGALLGALADKVERRTALIWILLTSLSTSLALAVLSLTGHLAVWQLALASFINGVAWAADNPVRRMMMGDVVGPDRVGTSISIDVGANQVSRMTGPTIGGFLLATSGIQGAFVLCVGLYVISLIAAFGVRYRKTPEQHALGVILERLIEGFRLAKSNSLLRGTLIITLIFNLFGWPFTSMVPVVGHDNLHLGPGGIGVLASMEGVGALFGAIAIGVFATKAQYGRIYAGGSIVYLVTLCLFALAPEPLSAGAALLLTGVSTACFSILQTTLVYLLTPPEMRARMLGVLVTYIGVSLLGFLHVGLLAEAIGAAWACVTIGVEGLLAMALTQRYWRELLRKDLAAA
jgi:MFS family permease